MSIWLSEDYARAARGGTGAAKCGGNYAASLLPQMEAQALGCSQVLFLIRSRGKYLEELGGMNVFLVYRDGRIVTRRCRAASSRHHPRKHPATGPRPRPAGGGAQRCPSMRWKDGVASARSAKVFACGTAAVITRSGS